MLVANEKFAADKVGGIENGDDLIKKCEKLFKTRKLSKSQKLAKSKKKLSKSGNLLNFDTKKNKPSFLTPDARIAFSYLRLVFTKASIL